MTDFEEDPLASKWVVYIDETGTISLPYVICDRLGFQIGDEVELDLDEQHIYMRHVQK